VVKNQQHGKRAVTLFAREAADPSRCHRGFEPMRIAIMPQQYRRSTTSPIGPMPVVGCRTWIVEQSAASQKRPFSAGPQISSDYVLKPAMRRPRTQS
jgi:hypothetical protein